MSKPRARKEDQRQIAETESSAVVEQTGEFDIDPKKLLHELQVHQVELEMQNDELNRAASQINFLLKEFTDLYDFAPIGYFTVGADGTIKRANLTAAKLLGVERSKLAAQPFRNFIDQQSRHDFDAFMAKMEAADDGDAASCQAALLRAGKSPLIAQLNAVVTEAKQTYRMVVTDITELKRLEAERETQAQRIRELSRSLVALQETERRKLGTELHDRTSGNLAALDLLLRDLGERMPVEVAAELAPQMEDIKGLLVETTLGIRDISADIRPALLDHGGLIPALEEYANRFTKHTGIEVQVLAKTERRVSAELESVLFRIIQEALTNCAKHSHAKSVEIMLTSPADKIVLKIEDDGYGFLPESLFTPGAQPGLGILSMKERAEFSGGRLTLKSDSGKGTRITVEFKQTQENPLWVVRNSDRRKPC